MKNGTEFLPAPERLRAPRSSTLKSRIVLACLAAALVAIGGCERASVSTPAPQARIAADIGSLEERLRTDPPRDRVWVLNSHGVFFYHTATPGSLVEVLLPSWQWADAPYGALPDLAVGPDGEAVVTSNVIPVLWRIDPETLAVTRHEIVLDADQDKDVGFSSLVYSAEREAFFATSDAHGTRWQIDRLLSNGRKIFPARTDNTASDRINAHFRCNTGSPPSPMKRMSA